MSKYLRITLICLAVTVAVSASIVLWKCFNEISKVNSKNICSDYDIIPQVIIENRNPFTKPFFLKKRNNDCKELLITDKEKALKDHDNEKCEILDDSESSVMMLVNFYVDEMYDRENASKEMNEMINSMLPYDYCENFYPHMISLMDMKRRLGL